jgi:phosphate transport system ATP-binding protein
LTQAKDPAFVRFQGIEKRFGDLVAVQPMDLDIPEGSFVTLLGPSGCGKTTLLKSLNKLTDLYRELRVSGQIFIEGDDILNTQKNVALIRQKMGLLSQKPFPLPVSIYKNVAYGIHLKGVKNKDLIDYNVEKKLREVGLWDEVKDRLHKSADSLSIGQQQRLCLARGLAVKPRIIFGNSHFATSPAVSRQCCFYALWRNH